MKTAWSGELLISSTVMKIYLSKSCQNFPAVFFLGLIWLIECKVPLDCVMLMDVFANFILRNYGYICGKLIQTLSSGLGGNLFFNALEIFNIKMIMPSADAIVIIVLRYFIVFTYLYDTLKSTPSSMDDPYEQFLECRSYWLSIYMVLTLNYILRRNFLSGGNEERLNVALKVVYFIFSQYFQNWILM